MRGYPLMSIPSPPDEPLGLSAAVQASSDVALITTDLKGRISVLGPGARDLLGYEPARMVGKDLSFVLSPDEKQAWYELLCKVREGDSVRGHEMVCVHRDGSPLDVRLVLWPIRSDLGDVVGVAILVEDALTRHRADTFEALSHVVTEAVCVPPEGQGCFEALAEACIGSVADFCLTYSAGPDGAVLRTAGAHVRQDALPVLEELDRVHSPGTEGHPVRAAIQEGRELAVWAVSPRAVKRFARSAEHHRLIQDLQPASVLVLPIWAGTEVMGAVVLGTVAGGTPGFQPEDLPRVRQVVGRAAFALRSRNEALAFVSHDLKNFLAAIEAGVRAVSDLHSSPEEKDMMLGRVLTTTQRAHQCTQDLLDATCSEVGRLALNRRKVFPQVLIHDAFQQMEDTARAMQVSVRMEVEECLPLVEVDPDRMHRVLMNLLANAVRHAGQGGQVWLGASRSGYGQVDLWVQDDGPGIAQELHERIFERYWRGNPRGGSGLGLSISRKLVRAHGGDIEVESNPEKGARFTCRIPVRHQRMEREPVAAVPGSAGPESGSPPPSRRRSS